MGINRFAVVLALLFVCSVVSRAEENNEEEEASYHILDIDLSDQPRKIDKDTFVDAIREPDVGSMIMFYAPWCGHCKRMVSTWSELARKHNKKGKFLIAKVDCADQTELCSDNDILGYPTYDFYREINNLLIF